MRGRSRAYQMGSETSTPCSREEHHHLHRPVFSFLLPHDGQLVLDKRCENGEVILERGNQILLGYMSVRRLFFLGDRRNVLVRWEQIKVCNLTIGVTITGTIDGRAAQTMRTSLGTVAENRRVCLLAKVRISTSTNPGT